MLLFGHKLENIFGDIVYIYIYLILCNYIGSINNPVNRFNVKIAFQSINSHTFLLSKTVLIEALIFRIMHIINML